MTRKMAPVTLLLAFLTLFSIPSLAADNSAPDAWQSEVTATTDINQLAQLYVDYLLEADPTNGGGLGIHGTDAEPWRYDRGLPDVSAPAWQRWYDNHVFLLRHLESLDSSAMAPQDRVDHYILRKQMEAEILDLTRMASTSNPLRYVGTLGGAFTSLILRDYGSLDERLRSFGTRCAATDEYLRQTRNALAPPHVLPTALQKQVAASRLSGMTEEGGLFDKTLPDLLAGSGLDRKSRNKIKEACGNASAAIDRFADWFNKAMEHRADGEWRLGADLYNARYEANMLYPLGPQELLAEAEAALAKTRAKLLATARKIHDGLLAEAIAAGETKVAADSSDKEVVSHVMEYIADDHSTAETLIADSYGLADAIVNFVQEHDLLDLPPTSKLRIEDIPPHLSGFAVAQIATAPPFEPDLESVWFWDLKLLATAPDYLREYNRAALALVYIHEGVPGHFVQLEYSNRFERITPRVFGNGAMIEGWATYIATQLVDQGFTIYSDHPFGRELQQISDYKLQLRSFINTIIDIRLHTTDWPEEDAVAMMMEMGFQEEGEARGKLSRAKLSSVQLTTYFAGHRAILGLLDEYRAQKGDQFRWKDFNERLVSAGSPPFLALRARLLGEELKLPD